MCFNVSTSQILSQAAGVISLSHSLRAVQITFYSTMCLFIVFVLNYTTFSTDFGPTQREGIPTEVVWTGYTKTIINLSIFFIAAM